MSYFVPQVNGKIRPDLISNLIDELYTFFFYLSLEHLNLVTSLLCVKL